MKKHDKTEMGLALGFAFMHKYGLTFLTREVMAALCQMHRPERIRQIEARALRKIRRQLTAEDWDALNHIFQVDRVAGTGRNDHVCRERSERE